MCDRDVPRPHGDTLRTSLMLSDLAALQSTSQGPHAVLVKTILIEDDSKALDPWSSPKLPSATSSYNIWPRDNGGNMIIASELCLPALARLLHDKVLRPETIRIRDYRIDRTNLKLCPEMIEARGRWNVTTLRHPSYDAIAALTRDIINATDLAIESLSIQHVDTPSFPPILNSPRFIGSGAMLASPSVKEAILHLSPKHQGQGIGFSMLHTAALHISGEATSFWLEQIFYHAPKLRNLKLCVGIPSDMKLDAARIVPQLTDFELSHSGISAQDIVAMLASSYDSLVSLRLRQVQLADESTWREVLSDIASNCVALRSFEIRVLRERKMGAMAVNFRQLKQVDMPQEHRAGLELVEMGPQDNKRVTRLSYSGLHARSVLEIVAANGAAGIHNGDFDSRDKTYSD